MKLNNCIAVFSRLNGCLFKGYLCNLQQSAFIVLKRHFTDWHTVGALCLERKPIITQPLIPLEQKYLQYLQKLEVEKSYLSDNEKRHIEDLKVTDKLKKGDVEDMDVVSKQTAQDFEDTWLEEFNKYKPNSRQTEADKTNDRHSLQRRLDSSLVLVIKQKLGNDYRWILPQAVHQNGETLRQTVEGVLHNICVDPVKVQFMGNAPVGYYKYKYPKAARANGICGAKVFFFKAQLLEKNPKSLNIKLSDTVSDAVWLTHSELNEVLQSGYGKTVQSFLFPDTFDIDVSHSLADSSLEDNEILLKTSVSN
ncbi:39S ribosomal protein L46, mitochondrial [Trichonephila inaurata madagascariensis]|uniref:Large ribosomal subunit protein mL46 n=1 Tax=Trichonephila inaurata madagascariensis TaxID=2747483 RepID=A0A8X7BR60_9ARAC|nr:39S ribosomal protein L46, mitochondrial [Trichonephila inaurata madagascariensis]